MEENCVVIVHFTTVLIISIHMITTQSVNYDGIIIAYVFTLIYLTLLKTQFTNYKKMFTKKYVNEGIYCNTLTNRMFTIMYTKMFLELAFISKAFPTNVAWVWPFTSMHTQMYI